ncbi:hypothetical protein ACLKOZ_16905 [Arthrobacter sp. R4]|uniref:hypothetical protein n=1 Tax=Arthrobacter sp. R4 TaxID=644417 RepID=UPI003ED996DB
MGEIQARLDAATPGPWFREYGDVITAHPDPRDMEEGYEDPRHARVVRAAPHLPKKDRQAISDAEFIAAAPADVAYLLAELRKATRAAQTLGQVIEKQCRDVLDVTGLHHLINADGDGHWDVVWMRLFEMRDELASLKESTIGRERLRGDSWRDRAQEMELSRDAAAAELRDRDEKLAKVEALHTRAFKPVETWAKGYRFTGEHCAFDGEHWPCATIAAVAAANGGGE